MNKIIKESFLKLASDRYLLVLCSAIILVAVSFAIYIGVSVRPSDLQLVSHYSAFGVTHLFRDQWYYLLLFGVFGLGVATIHTALVTKLLVEKDRNIAIFLAWLTIAILVFAWMSTYAVINVWSPS